MINCSTSTDLMPVLCQCEYCGLEPSLVDGDLVCKECTNNTSFEIDFDYVGMILEDLQKGPYKVHGKEIFPVINTLWAFKNM